MIEKPNKDGKTQTIEYQEEEILVSMKLTILIQLIFSVNAAVTKNMQIWVIEPNLHTPHTPQPILIRTK